MFRDSKGFVSRKGRGAPSHPFLCFPSSFKTDTMKAAQAIPSFDHTSCRLSNPIKGDATSVFLQRTTSSFSLHPNSESGVDNHQIPIIIPFRCTVVLSLSPNLIYILYPNYITALIFSYTCQYILPIIENVGCSWRRTGYVFSIKHMNVIVSTLLCEANNAPRVMPTS
jgi:hypothetical protein